MRTNRRNLRSLTSLIDFWCCDRKLKLAEWNCRLITEDGNPENRKLQITGGLYAWSLASDIPLLQE
jgi:hypothetical protein